MPLSDDLTWMQMAIDEAQRAAQEGEVPVGAVVVVEGRVVGRGRNQKETLHDPTAHAEILALRDAAEALGVWRLQGAVLYATLEPCPMCAGALVQARVARVVFGCRDPKAGAVGSLMNLVQDARLNHRMDVAEGIYGQESARLLKDFFLARRGPGNRTQRGPEREFGELAELVEGA